MLTEAQISDTHPALLRYHEARFFLSRFLASCGPPRDSYFEMISYFDAFLFCLISVEDMVSEEQKQRLRSKDVFSFLKAARNLTSHHSVLASPNQRGQYVRPFSRLINEGQQASARLRVTINEFRQVFELATCNWPRSREGFQAAEPYLAALEARGTQDIFLEDVMQEGLDAVREVLGV